MRRWIGFGLVASLVFCAPLHAEDDTLPGPSLRAELTFGGGQAGAFSLNGVPLAAAQPLRGAARADAGADGAEAFVKGFALTSLSIAAATAAAAWLFVRMLEDGTEQEMSGASSGGETAPPSCSVELGGQCVEGS